MKKHNYKTIGAVSILCLAAIATSCSQELEEGKVQTDNNKAELNVVKINFATEALTRGTMYDDIVQMPDDATFGVYGYAHKDNLSPTCEPNFINNGSAKKKDGIVHVDGEMATYKKDMPNVQLAAVFPRLSGGDGCTLKKDGKDTYTLTYFLQKDMAKQKDLLIGQADEFSITDENSKNSLVKGGKIIDMHHALTAINFAIGDCVPTGYTIEGISLQGLYTNGTCHIDLSKPTDAERFTWDLTNATKGEVHIKTNHATTTKINGTQFTGLKGSDNKYDNLTVFMIPQKLNDKAVAEVYLKRDETVKINGDKRKTKMIPIHLLTEIKTKKDGGNNETTYKGITEYKAGEVIKYRMSDDIYKKMNLNNTKTETDVKLCVKVLYPKEAKKYEETLDPQTLKSHSSSINFKNPKKLLYEKIDKEPHTYKVYVESYRYAGYIGEGKDLSKVMVAPQTFKIKNIKYKKKRKDKEYIDLPEGSWEAKVVKQPKGNDKVGAFTLTFHPEIIFPQGKKGKFVPQTPLPIFIKIFIVLDGFEGTVFEIEGKDLPMA